MGENEALQAVVYPDIATNKTIIWSSSNIDVASVSVGGTVVAKEIGSATITAATINGNNIATCNVVVTVPTEEHGLWGLGKNLTKSHSNNVDYEWYIDQVYTGPHSYVNCGPACATMAIKWADQTFTKTTEDARNTYLPEGGWWYTNDIMAYLTDNHTTSYTTSFIDAAPLITLLDNGSIAILCLDIYYVRRNLTNPEWRIDKFYATTSPQSGHFIIVKGYKIVDDIIWFEVYDPWSLNMRYSNDTLMGRDRFYRSGDLIHAADVWWKYMIVINNPAVTTPGTKAIDPSAIDPSTIVHQWGR